MRSKIEANEYKDYILGFIFYKYLSDQQVQFAEDEGMSSAEIASLSENDIETADYIKKGLGYFIAYEDLFSTWLDKGSDFDVSNVRDALSAFERLTHNNHKKLFDGIFNTLQTGLSKLGESSAKQTKAISDLLQLIKAIPMDRTQDFDVLGYIYEYLLEKFAANAGKKAGEFYTPHEVSLLMSEIIACHLKDKEKIEIYDPTSGSGSLLINIGNSVAKHDERQNNIKYYAQELKANTYNLTRMNLIMRGIKPNNIVTRNGDTLEEDWPYFDENDPQGSYDPLYVDAVVSNPPYSQRWDPEYKENDPRYSRFGLAPKAKADYAFLLHDLYHLKPDGMMNIVLPHGVLFRGGDEGKIRKQLIEQNHIDAIIGLPANIFFGTGIPTVILVLRQRRSNTDVLIIDASKHFLKVGKNNKLQASDIKRIADAIISRENNPKFSQLVSKNTLREKDYNLNISMYVDSAAAAESWDLHATMLGGIPVSEINQFDHYWQAFPTLRKALFTNTSSHYAQLAIKRDDVKHTITQHNEVKSFIQTYSNAFSDFDSYLKTELISQWRTIKITQHEGILSNELFARIAKTAINNMALIDKYQAYQLLNNHWQTISVDLEMLQTEGFKTSKQVDPNMVNKKVKGRDTEVQDGWKGHVLPFDLVQTSFLNDNLQALKQQQNRLHEIGVELEEIIDSFTEEEKISAILNNGNTAFVKAEVTKVLKKIYVDVESEEINILKAYLKLLDNKAKKPEKLDFIESHNQVKWENIQANKDGTYGKGNVNKYILTLQSQVEFSADLFESKIVKANGLLSEVGDLKKEVKVNAEALHLKTKTTIENLSDEQVNNLLELKWLTPLLSELSQLPTNLIHQLTSQVQKLADKYATTYADVANEIKNTEQILAGLIDELTGNEFDQQGLAELKMFLQGE